MAMKTTNQSFTDRLEDNLQNQFMRNAVSSAQNRLHSKRSIETELLGNWEDWRNHGEEIRQHVLEHLDYYLYELSEQVLKRGGHVYFAKTAEEASSYITTIAKKKNAKKIVKSKSMVT